MSAPAPQPALQLVHSRPVPQRPSLILAGAAALQDFANFDQLAQAVRVLVAGRLATLTDGFAGWPGFDTFPVVTVRVGDEFLCACALQGFDARDLAGAINSASVVA